jgi:hypothetical protein
MHSSVKARRAVLGCLAVFVAGNLALAVALQVRGSGLRDPAYAQRLRTYRARLAAAAPGTRTVIALGSSRVNWGLRANQLGESLTRTLGKPVLAGNFAIDGGGFRMSLLQWRRLHRDGFRPDLLLVEVLPALLGHWPRWEELGKDVLPLNLLFWDDLPVLERYAGAYRRGLRRDWLVQVPLPCYHHREPLMSRLVPNLLSYMQRGRYFPPGSADDWPDLEHLPPSPREKALHGRAAALELIRNDYATRLEGFRLGAQPCAALEEILTSCRAAGVPAALMILPESPIFHTWYPPGAWEMIAAYLESLRRRLGVPLINGRDWIADEMAYLDSHHLLPAGAGQFTAGLAAAVAPLLKQR